MGIRNGQSFFTSRIYCRTTWILFGSRPILGWKIPNFIGQISCLEKPFYLLPGNPASDRYYPVSLWNRGHWVHDPPGFNHCLSAHLSHMDGWFPPGSEGYHLKKRPLENDAARHAHEAFYRIVFEIASPEQESCCFCSTGLAGLEEPLL